VDRPGFLFFSGVCALKKSVDIRAYTCYNIDRKRGEDVKQSELLKLFSKNNIKLLQHGKRHDIYYSPITGKKFPVPRHAKEMAEGTLKSIKKDAGLK
jgi:mRNA interferase HicA